MTAKPVLTTEEIKTLKRVFMSASTAPSDVLQKGIEFLDGLTAAESPSPQEAGAKIKTVCFECGFVVDLGPHYHGYKCSHHPDALIAHLDAQKE